MRRTCVVVALVALLCMIPSGPGARASSVRLAFVSNGDVYVREADGSVHQLTNFTDYENTRAEQWSPDGSQMAAIVNDHGNGIVVFRTDQSNPITAPRVLLPEDSKNDIGTLHWSPDGTQLVYNLTATGSGTLATIDVVTAVARPVPGVTDAQAPQFTPDGKRVLFVHGQHNDELATVAPDGTGYQRVLADAGIPAPMTDAAYSPNGKLLAIEVFFGTQGSEIYTVAADGSTTARATGLRGKESECFGPGSASWTSDNAHLVAGLGSCNTGAPPGRLAQIGIDDGSVVTIPLPGFTDRAGLAEVFGDGLVVPIPAPAKTTTTRRVTTTTERAAPDSTTTEDTTTTVAAKPLTLQRQSRDGGGGLTGWLAGGALVAGGGAVAASILWRRQRAKVT